MSEPKISSADTSQADIAGIEDLPRKADAPSHVDAAAADQVTGGVSPCDRKTYPGGPVPIPYPNL